MQVNGINSYSAPKMAFKGEGAEEKKGINKKAAIAAGVGAAAVIGATVAAGLHGKKVFVGPPEANKAKNALAYIITGFKDALGVINKHVVDIRESIAEKFAKKAPEAEKAAEEAMQ